MSQHRVITYIALGLILFLTCIASCNSCRNASKIKQLNQKVENNQEKLDQEIDTLAKIIDSNTHSKQELNNRLNILKYEMSKNILYDWNAIIRSETRPDDRMNYYDERINQIKND